MRTTIENNEKHFQHDLWSDGQILMKRSSDRFVQCVDKNRSVVIFSNLKYFQENCAKC